RFAALTGLPIKSMETGVGIAVPALAGVAVMGLARQAASNRRQKIASIPYKSQRVRMAATLHVAFELSRAPLYGAPLRQKRTSDRCLPDRRPRRGKWEHLVLETSRNFWTSPLAHKSPYPRTPFHRRRRKGSKRSFSPPRPGPPRKRSLLSWGGLAGKGQG